MIVPREPQSASDVAQHYDELDPFYREIWGQHVHHGLWIKGSETPEEAVEALVDRLADRLSLEPRHHVCDVGCGYGATALRLTQRSSVRVTGLTISPVQAARAQKAMHNSPLVQIRCEDWLSNSLPDSVFDRAYAIESSEHMVDKKRFFGEAYRTVRPGGLFGVYAWLARDGAHNWEVKHLLEPICREGRLPSMGTEADYRWLAESVGFKTISVEDLSKNVRRTWSICARRVTSKLLTNNSYRRFIFDQRSTNRVFALTLVRLVLAYRTGAMRYCLLMFKKPS